MWSKAFVKRVYRSSYPFSMQMCIMWNFLWEALENTGSLLLCGWSLPSAQMCPATLILYLSFLVIQVLIFMMKDHMCWAWLPDRTQTETGFLATLEPWIPGLCLAPLKDAFSLKAVLPAFCSLIFSYPLCVRAIVCDHRRTSQLCLRALEEFPRGDDIS